MRRGGQFTNQENLSGQAAPDERGAWSFALLAAALSGLISGFVFSGYVTIGAAAFVAVVVGIFIGWCARGAAE
ncbi:hypothetical protein PX860_27140 (plasmid) [Agrobacterium leguminum]|uniref:hypothetical protein n=1 Tax=Agrobacterium leguminum TaxID=2792015 RepID=UPI00272C9256|nr:hypothetical protein [Agrobacterium leguminum]WLE00560.1 hypothetical protein PX860_27140 [Agrobacterium leguminum]